MFLYAMPILLFITLAGALAHRILLWPALALTALIHRVTSLTEEQQDKVANSIAAGLMVAGAFALQLFPPAG